jgi:hypothetical protein
VKPTLESRFMVVGHADMLVYQFQFTIMCILVCSDHSKT